MDPQHIHLEFVQHDRRSFNIDQTYSFSKNSEINNIIFLQCIQTYSTAYFQSNL